MRPDSSNDEVRCGFAACPGPCAPNLLLTFVYRSPMRLLIILSFVVQVAVHAQPTFCFVLAQDEGSARPLRQCETVVQHYRERVPYVGFNATWLGPALGLTLEGGPLFRDSTKQWLVHTPVGGMAESYVLVVHHQDTMRIDLPEDSKELIDRAWRRGERDTPEVIRFRKGRYAMQELVADRWAVAAAHALAERLIAEDDAAHKLELAQLEEHYRNQPPPVPPTPPCTPPQPMAPEDWETYWAQQPPLKDARLDHRKADTLWVRITGRVMLNGGCGSGMPLFGVEVLTDTGWVERIPFERIQMDCGMPWADWDDHVVIMPPLRWWVGTHQSEGRKGLAPGSYRLFFIGGNGRELRTEAFPVD